MECVAHCTELGSSLFFQSRPDSSLPEGLVVETMAKFWISFIKRGDPNVERKAGSIEWPKYTTLVADSAGRSVGDPEVENHFPQNRLL
eukprot:gene29779-10208_t